MDGRYCDKKRAEMLKLLQEYEVNIEYWALKHNWELDIQNFEYIF